MQFIYKYKTVPEMFSDKLNWNHISMAIEHLLYHKIALSLKKITTKYDNQTVTNNSINHMSTLLQKQSTISTNEMKYIKKIMHQAIRFEPISISNAIRFHKIRVFKDRDISNEYDIDEPHTGVTLNILYDIYGVHNCYLFWNYQFKQYKKNEFISNI
eukprot:210948_1